MAHSKGKMKTEQSGEVPAERSKASANVATACTNCQKRRTKCDGKTPCIKCTNRPGSICTYEISLKASKTEMKRENTQLRQHLAWSTQLLTALASDNEASSILQGLRDREDLATIAQRITSASPPLQMKRSSSADSCGLTLSYVPHHGKQENGPSNFSPAYESPSIKTSPMTHESDFSTLDSPYESPVTRPPATTREASTQTPQVRETHATARSVRELRNNACRGPTDLSDHRLIKHLFSVYWIWVHPAHTILTMEQFVKGYETGVESYCSLYLIYAVCIAACEYLDPLWENVEGKFTDVALLRQNLEREARALEATMDPNHRTKTAVQASAILSLANGRSQPFDGKTLV